MTHRPPTRHDIGRQVEVSRDGEEWLQAELHSFDVYADVIRYYVWNGLHGFVDYEHCRVPYTTPDPIAELSAAADLLAEHGMDEAARVLMLVADRMSKGRNPVADIQLLMELNNRLLIELNK